MRVFMHKIFFSTFVSVLLSKKRRGNGKRAARLPLMKGEGFRSSFRKLSEGSGASEVKGSKTLRLN